MKITTFNNMRGLIHGGDPKRICCAKDGTLKIGATEVSVSSTGESILPLLFHGATGDYDATFTDSNGVVFTLDKVAVRNGRIEAPSDTAAEFMELRCRLDEDEAERDALKEKVKELSQMFDTNSLNFLIR